MGSGSSRSSQVQALQAEPTYRELSEQAKDRTTLTPRNKDSSRSPLKIPSKSEGPVDNNNEIQPLGDIGSKKGQTQNHKDKNSNMSSKVKDLEKQLAESESQILDYQDRIQFLEERIEYMNTQNDIARQEDNYTETLNAKDQYIAKIEKDLQTHKQETDKLKVRYKRRIKLLTAQLNEAKQETSIQLFEMKDDINRLTEENQKLQGKVSGPNLEGSAGNLDNSDGATDSNKMTIILELSNQISEQTEKINDLEKSLEERDKIIEQMKLSSHKSSRPDALKYVNKKSSQSEDVIRASYEGDKETIQNESLRKLSIGLSSYTKTEGTNDNFKLDSSEDEELRGLSGASRDSGIGSAKKNGRNESNKKPPSRLSALSDSDWDTDEQLPVQSKIRSAPPDKSKRVLSGVSLLSTKTASDGEDDLISIGDTSSITGSGKKKKKSAIKKHIGKDDDFRRTPITSQAFENKSGYPDMKSNSKTNKNTFFLTQSISPDSSNSGMPIS